jgi:N-acetylglucosaminyldiphosphoundecaprenol N-acetyl-beta-D-mannosaminyltransferase
MLATIPPYLDTLPTGAASGRLKPMPLRRRVIRLNLTIQSYAEFIRDVLEAAHRRQSAYVCCANVHMVVEAVRDPAFAQAVNKATWVTGDGVPLLWALRAFYGIRQERITGLDVMPTLLAEAARTNLRVLFYGSTPQVLERCAAFCSKHYPALQITGLISPPFRTLTPAEEQSMIEAITLSGAGLVFVALGCPKQEKWMAALSDRIPAVLLGIGGALPVTVGEQKRAPRWMQRAGLEWFFRLLQEPRRLFGRYATTNLLFVYYFLRHLMDPPKRHPTDL